MQSKKEEFMIDLEASDVEEYHPGSYQLYEEYSQKNIFETIKACRENFDKANLKAKKELLIKVENELESFCVWLQETKHFHSVLAHYYSVSLKSLLLGLPLGVQFACLFDIMLNAQIK
jgi:hypothetical protein